MVLAIYFLHQVITKIKLGKIKMTGRKNVLKCTNVYSTKLWLKFKGRAHCGWRMRLQRDFMDQSFSPCGWTKCNWLRLGTGSGLL